MKGVYIFLAIFFVFVFFAQRIPLVTASKPSDHGLKEGDLISAIFSDDPDVYIINEHGYKRLFLNPEIFKFYKHLGGFANIKLVTSEVRDSFSTAGLFRNCEEKDQRVFGIDVEGEDQGQLHWVNTTGDQAVKDDHDFFKKVFCINKKEFNWYKKASEFNSVTEVPEYDRVIETTAISTQERLESKAETKNIGKVIICHYPPENIQFYQTLTIDASALKAHLDHGDTVGACLSPTPTPTPSASPGPTASPSATPIITISPSPTSSTSFSPTPTPTIIITATPAPTTGSAPPSVSSTPTPTPTSTSSPPVISNIQLSSATNSFTVKWTTDKLSDSLVKYYIDLTPYDTKSAIYYEGLYINSEKYDSAMAINHSITIDNLSSGIEFRFQIFSKDSSGNVSTNLTYFLGWTLAASPTPTPTPTPAPDYNTLPNNVSGVTGYSSGGNVYLTWTDNSSNETEFRIYRRSRASNDSRSAVISNWVTINLVGANVTSFTDNLISSGYYEYRVGACNYSYASSDPVFGTVACASNSGGPIITVTVPTPTPVTSSISYDNFSRDLALGSRGNDVKQLQALLVNEVSYPANFITGYFGNITRNAVKRLQEKYGVRPVSGYFGEITRRMLNALISH